MHIISARNPHRTASGGIDMLATFSGIGEIPFHATIDDTEPHGRDLFARATQGEFGPVAPYVEPAVPLQDLFAAKMEAVNEGKNRALDAGFTTVVMGGEFPVAVLFDSDAKARLAYLELAVKLGQDQAYSTPWKASRGQWVTMDTALFAALQPAYEAHIQACFAWQAAREMEVAAALALVDPETGDEAAARAALVAISEKI